MHQFHVGEPEPGPCSCPEEEVLIFHQVREFRQVKLQDVGACATLDWRVQHLARDLVLHAGQSSPIRLLADSLGEQVGEDDVIEVIDDNRRGAGGLLACSNARSCIYAAIPILDCPLANRACTSVQMNAGISRQRVDDVDGARLPGLRRCRSSWAGREALAAGPAEGEAGSARFVTCSLAQNGFLERLPCPPCAD
jgi:hypothetical protein